MYPSIPTVYLSGTGVNASKISPFMPLVGRDPHPPTVVVARCILVNIRQVRAHWFIICHICSPPPPREGPQRPHTRCTPEQRIPRDFGKQALQQQRGPWFLQENVLSSFGHPQGL